MTQVDDDYDAWAEAGRAAMKLVECSGDDWMLEMWDSIEKCPVRITDTWKHVVHGLFIGRDSDSGRLYLSVPSCRSPLHEAWLEGRFK